jgi:hypothetical protein
MSQPSRLDDVSIENEEKLFRRVHLSLLVRDEDTGLARISTGAFKDKELSVHLESVLTKVGLRPESCLRDHHAHKLISITARDARSFNQAVCRDPLPEDVSHGLVCGSKNNRKIQEGLRSAATWIIPTAAPNYDEIETERRTLGLQ